ncbi:MAG: PHP domain-containing protein [Clostridia bacterium]|nr:PHP domain-containing protein [Clostridia bacterium]
MELNYDFHLHSCLSPCGDNDMTPYNLVNMAKIMGLDAIALTDHNTCLNCEAAMKVGKEAGILVIPGMELCTDEEVHVVCLFPALENAMAFSRYVRERIPPVENRPEIFGDQFVMDDRDNIIGSEKLLLTTAANVSLDKVPEIMKEFGGISFPAHIDRSSYSVISNLGMIDEYMGFSTAEITKKADKNEYIKKYPVLERMHILTSSDAHYLENIGEAGGKINVEVCEIDKILSILSKSC